MPVALKPVAPRLILSLALGAGVALGACEQSPGDGEAPADTGGDMQGADGGGDAQGAEDAAHGHDEGERHDLGEAAIGEHQVHVARFGELTPGAECSVDIEVTGEAPAAVRVWIGAEDGAGALKSRAEAEDDGYHAHIEVPEPLPEGALLWVEVESSAGETSTASFPLQG